MQQGEAPLLRKKSAGSFQIRFEPLEPREMMAVERGDRLSQYDALLESHRAIRRSRLGAHRGRFGPEHFQPVPGQQQPRDDRDAPRAHGHSAASGASANPAPTPAPTPTPAPVSDWFSANLHDAALQTPTRQEAATDGNLSRQDMLNIFAEVEKDGTVTTNEFNDLKTIIATPTLFSSDSYVDVLASDVVNGNAANATYQGSQLGNLTANSTGGASHVAGSTSGT